MINRVTLKRQLNLLTAKAIIEANSRVSSTVGTVMITEFTKYLARPAWTQASLKFSKLNEPPKLQYPYLSVSAFGRRAVNSVHSSGINHITDNAIRMRCVPVCLFFFRPRPVAASGSAMVDGEVNAALIRRPY